MPDTAAGVFQRGLRCGYHQGVRAPRSEAYVSTPQRRGVKHNADACNFKQRRPLCHAQNYAGGTGS